MTREDDWKAASRAGKIKDTPIWRSESLELLGIGLSVGDITGDGKNEIVVIDPSTVYVYGLANKKLARLYEYSVSPMEIKSVDVAKLRKKGSARIYVTAQNRGVISSFVLELRGSVLEPVIRNVKYYLRVISYPSRGPLLLGQQRGINKIYEGYIHLLEDAGSEIISKGRFGVPLKIPIFGFAIGDLVGNRQPLIAVYDRDDYLRLYTPKGKRIYKSRDHYGGSDVILRLEGIEEAAQKNPDMIGDKDDIREYYRARILCEDFNADGKYDVIVTKHASATRRVLSRMKMLEEGEIVSLEWNGDSLEAQWRTPKVQGMITDFAISKLPGLPGRRLITLEREKTDWLSFLRSRSRVRAYDLEKLIKGTIKPKGGE